MDNNQSYIDQIIKEKLEQFQPTPPVEVWAGIEKGLAAQEKPAFILLYARQIAVAAAVLAAVLFALWYFIPQTLTNQNSDIEVEHKSVQSELMPEVIPADNVESQETQIESTDIVAVDEDSTIKHETNFAKADNLAEATIEKQKPEDALAPSDATTTDDFQKPLESSPLSDYQLKHLETRKLSHEFLTGLLESETEDGTVAGVLVSNTKTTVLASDLTAEVELPEFKNYWNIGLYFAPEMTLNNIDSVTFMTTYSVNIEPSWYFSKHWFMRFGAGASYIRDHGYAKVDYLSNDYQGAYDSVYNVTFDTIDNVAYPVYHTKEVDIWDTIQHLSVSEVTNTYYYIQLPLLFGYHNSTDKFKWYFYGGPAVNISISQQIQDPKSTIDYTEIIHLENDLPQRTNYSMQLWIGAGIDFRVSKRFSVAFEPNYRYYFEPIYQEKNYKTALSGLGLRFGLVYKFIE